MYVFDFSHLFTKTEVSLSYTPYKPIAETDREGNQQEKIFHNKIKMKQVTHSLFSVMNFLLKYGKVD